MQDVVRREWGEGLIRSWNNARWMEISHRIADRIAPLIGVSPRRTPRRQHQRHAVQVAPSPPCGCAPTATWSWSSRRPSRPTATSSPGSPDLLGLELRWCDPADPLASLDEDVALLSLTHVDFRTGAMFDMAAITEGAHAAGALMQWDLCHSAGAVPVDLTGAAPTSPSGAPTSTSTADPAPPPSSGSRRSPGRARPADHRLVGHARPVRDGVGLRAGRRDQLVPPAPRRCWPCRRSRPRSSLFDGVASPTSAGARSR